MQVLQCAWSGQSPIDPVLCCKTGLAFERALIEPEVRKNGACPVTKVPVDFDTDFVRIQAPKYNTHGGFSLTFNESTKLMQDILESQVTEAVKLKSESSELKSKLKNALTRQEARIEVIRKLVTERDTLRSKLATGSSSRIVNELLEQFSHTDSHVDWKASLHQKSEMFELQKDSIRGNQVAQVDGESSKPSSSLDASSLLDKLRKEVAAQIESNSLRLNRVRKQLAQSNPTDPYLSQVSKSQKLQVSLKSSLKGLKGDCKLLGFHPINSELALLFADGHVLAVDLSTPEDKDTMSSSKRNESHTCFKVKVGSHSPNNKLAGRKPVPQLLPKFCYDEYSFGLAVVSGKDVEIWEVKLDSEQPETGNKSRKLFSVLFPQDVAQVVTHPLERLLVVSHGENISLVDFASRGIIQTFHAQLGEIDRGEDVQNGEQVNHTWLEWHPDGTLVAWSSNQEKKLIGLINVATGEILTELETNINFVSG